MSVFVMAALLLVSEPAETAGSVMWEFLARFGVAEPDRRAKFEVALRKSLSFAYIANSCWIESNTAASMRLCLDQKEKAEVALGHDLNAPSPEALALKKLLGLPVD